MEKKTILKTLVGSRAHGLETPESDYDYRGVYIGLTKDLVGINPTKTKGTHWVEGGNEDDTAYEIGHYLHLATKSHPTILETLIAPTVQMNALGLRLRGFFPIIWNTNDVVNAFVGYSLNQRKKFLDRNEKRRNKFAVAYLRTLDQCQGLITTGELMIKVPEKNRDFLRAVKNGEVPTGEIVNIAEAATEDIYHTRDEIQGTDLENFTDHEQLDKFLVETRYQNYFEFVNYADVKKLVG